MMVTHEPDIAGFMKRIIEMRDGRITRDEPVKDRAHRGGRPGRAHAAAGRLT